MVEPNTVVAPSVGVGVEMDQCQRAVLPCVGSKQRIGDEVVAAEGQQHRSRIDDLLRIGLDGCGYFGRIRKIEGQIAVIDDRHLGDRMKIPAVDEPLVGEQRRGRADAARAEARAGPIGRRCVERHAEYCDVDSLEILAVGAPEETRDA
jgi:hypothetical protein